ncbi:MAG: spore coat protein [Proteobacteria bacterium]|nr:spore coat protein [Pseudomonadota bacterium]
MSCNGDPPDIERPDFWTLKSHCRGVEPDYEEVFDDSVLHQFKIVISPADYEAMMDDMDDKFGGTATFLDLDELPNPIWIPADVIYNGKRWTKVGIRWKGHSSLKAAWQGGIRKLSFLLTFDYFEDTHPDLLNQRFFGFKKLSFSNAYNDAAIIREKVAYEIYRSADIPAARCAFAPIYLDWGEGPVYLGMYTMIEDPSNKMLFEQFGDDTGNLYKPWGNAARWLNPDVIYSWQDEDWQEDDWKDDIALHFEKSNNDDYPDWSDVERVIKRLHRDRNNPDLWRTNLEEVFDVQSFIKKLAIDRAIVNWDNYGCMHHNYYIYANPLDSDRFTWIPWDLNEAMLNREQSGCPDPGSVMLDEIVYGDSSETEIDTDWPLIQFVLADQVYRAAYKRVLEATIKGPFAIGAVHALIDKYHNLVAPYVIGPKETEAYPYTNTTAEGFTNSVDGMESALKPHVESRHAAVKAALGI